MKHQGLRIAVALAGLLAMQVAGRAQRELASGLEESATKQAARPTPSSSPQQIAAAEAKKTRSAERVMGICLPTPYVAPGSEPNVYAATMAFPDSNARDYFSMYEKVELDLPPISSVEIVKAPTHVKLVFDKSRGGEDALYFVPEPGYVGRDYAELQLNVDGRLVKLAYFIHVTKADLNTPGARPRFCPKEPYWKISTSGSSLPDWQRSASVSARAMPPRA